MSSSALPLSSLYHSCLWDIQVRYEVDADINEGIFKTKVLLMLLWIFIMLLIAAKYQTCTCACVQCTCTRYLSLPTRYPWHASCKLQWTFTSLSCSQVQLSSIKRENRWKIMYIHARENITWSLKLVHTQIWAWALTKNQRDNHAPLNFVVSI